MSIGLISENKIREKLRKELEKDIKKFLENGGEIQKFTTKDARFWHNEKHSAESYRKGITISKRKRHGQG